MGIPGCNKGTAEFPSPAWECAKGGGPDNPASTDAVVYKGAFPPAKYCKEI